VLADGADAADVGDAPSTVACSLAQPCAPDSYCTYADTRCGTLQQMGVCRPLATNCSSDLGHEYCGCDGTAYAGSCGPAQNGVDLNSLGSSFMGCPTSSSSYVCGYVFCSFNEYCERHGSNPVFTWACHPFSGLPNCSGVPPSVLATCTCRATGATGAAFVDCP
jgi:hypothetical protein